MTAAIGSLWEEGEALRDAGDFHQAVLHFQRAKTLLLIETKKYDRPSKVLGEIMGRLATSIDSSLGVLGNNPILTLGLARGYTQADVKKGYRKMALKYHPDKNTDCDSSSLFTLIQTAYERVLPNAPIASESKLPSNMYKDFNYGHAQARHDEPPVSNYHKPAEQPTRPPGGGGLNNKFFNPRSDSTSSSGANNSTKPPPSAAPSSAAGKSRPSSSTSAKKTTSSKAASASSATANASNVSSMNTEDLRDAIRVFGFAGVDKMTREQLLKKMLAIKAYLDKQKQNGTNYDSSDTSGSNSKTKSDENPKARRDFAREWEEEIKREMDGGKRADVRKEREAQQRWDDAKAREDAAAKKVAQEEEERRKQRDATADSHRRQREDVLAKELPLMSIVDLKKMMVANKISTDGCVEKQDLLDKLYKYFGVKPLYSHPNPSDNGSYKFQNDKPVPTFSPINGSRPTGGSVNTDENQSKAKRPFFNSKNVSSASEGSTVLPSIFKESEKITEKNKAKISNIMKDDELKFVVGESVKKADGAKYSVPAPEKFSTAPAPATTTETDVINNEHINSTAKMHSASAKSSPDETFKKTLQSPVWTTEKLKILEQKMWKRGIKPRSTIPQDLPNFTNTTKNCDVDGDKEDEPFYSAALPHVKIPKDSDDRRNEPSQPSSEKSGEKKKRFSPEKDSSPTEDPFSVEYEPISNKPSPKLNQYSPSSPDEISSSNRGSRLRERRFNRHADKSPGYKGTLDEQKQRLHDHIKEEQAELDKMKSYADELKRKIAMDQDELKKKLEDDGDVNFYVFDHGRDRYGKLLDSDALKEQLRMNKKSPSIPSSTVESSRSGKNNGSNSKIYLKPDATNDHEYTEPTVVLNHAGFYDEDDDDDAASNSGPDNKQSVAIDSNNFDYSDPFGVSKECSTSDEKMDREKQRANRKTMLFPISIKANVPTDFPDDFIDLPWNKFIPPVISTNSPSGKSPNRNRNRPLTQSTSSASNVFDPNASSADIKISLPTGGMGNYDEDDDDEEEDYYCVQVDHDDAFIFTQRDVDPTTGRIIINEIDGVSHASNDCNTPAPHAVFHKTLRVDRSEEAHQSQPRKTHRDGDGRDGATLSPQTSPHRFDFKHDLDSFDER